jgi:FtsZ-interacting cell division protein ZipA
LARRLSKILICSALELAEALDGWVLDEENRAGLVEELQVAVWGEA